MFRRIVAKNLRAVLLFSFALVAPTVVSAAPIQRPIATTLTASAVAPMRGVERFWNPRLPIIRRLIIWLHEELGVPKP